MKKFFGSFFSSLFAIALGIGLASSSLYEGEPLRWQEPAPTLSFTDGVATLGRYPQTLSDVDPIIIKAEGTVEANGWYRYNQKLYAIKTVEIDSEYASVANWNNGSEAASMRGAEKAFLVEELEWEVLSTKEGYADIISRRIIDRQLFDHSKTNYKSSALYTFLNEDFYNKAFDDPDKSYLQSYDSNSQYYVELPEVDVLRTYEDEKAKYPSDYAIASNLSANPGNGGRPYWNGPFWTKTVGAQNDRVAAYWTRNGKTDCLPTDPKIGVRPVLRIVANASTGGGPGISTVDPSSPSKSSRGGGGGNVTLGLGIAFMVIGAGGLIAFFVLWSKKHKNGKPPLWIIISIGCCLVISVVGIGCFSSGVGGGNAIYGWYGGNGYDCVNWGERLAMNLTKDGKVYRYVADAWAEYTKSASNYLLIRQEGVGEWSYSGGKLTIYAAPEWRLSSWEHLEMTYDDAHGIGSFLHYEGYVGTAYQWYHYSTMDSAGIESIWSVDTGEGEGIWK